MTIQDEVPPVVEQPGTSLFDSLPAIDGPWPQGQPARRKRSERRGFDRRGFIKRATAAGMSLGLASLTVFPPARAFASSGHDILNSCPSYADGHNCSPGCGPSTVRTAACGPNGYHEATGCFYRLRRNECYGGWADGWNWRPTGCSQCGTARTGFRCHDGWTCPDSCGGCYKTICRYFIGCS